MSHVIRTSLVFIALTMLLTSQFTRPLVLDVYTDHPIYSSYNKVVDHIVFGLRIED